MKYLVVVALLASGGCTAFGNPERVRLNPSVVALVQPGNVRSAYIRDTRVCPEPPPDLGFQPDFGSSAKVETKAGTKAEGGVNYSATVVPLAGRSSPVLFGRDSGSLLCILAMNDFLPPEKIDGAFSKYLETAVAFAKADQAASEAVKAVAQAETVKAITAAKIAVPDIDPAILARVSDTISQEDRAAKTVADRFTRSDGKIIMADLAAFVAQDQIKKLLGDEAASRLGSVSSRDELMFLLTRSYSDYVKPLATQAQAF